MFAFEIRVFYLGVEHASSMITLSSSKRLLHISCNLGSSQLSSSKTLMRTLAPYCNFYISSKQSSIVSTEIFINIMLGIGLIMLSCRSSISDAEQIVWSQGGSSMNSSSDIPNLQRNCCKIH